ncbi:hypothetical protein SKAU_G00331440 [Synaphobranchus kaupii]|uniref:SAND domain-containing protein n=1 Tax=Synaphobranchus kaupii TaxID=118154 RepID=A0A9Q1EL86_SYNKA|nr:hypothetical protein SKAU_G00331440 [Synaphobranchus kaupii]
MGTAIVAVETHNEDGTAEGEEIEYGYPITCGGSRAVLLFKKFVCPGINVKCVKYNDQLISPKQFVHMAGKATLKDWKRAIRLGGVMLRKMMDSGQIDFYQHDSVCTNTCRSTKFDVLISSTRFPPLGNPPPGNAPLGNALPAPPSPQGNGGPVAAVEDQPKETVATAVEWSSSVVTAIATATKAEIKREMGEISEETVSLWKGVAEVGLMAEVVSNMRTELLALLRDIQLRSGLGALQEPDAAVLHTLAQMFGLLDSVKRALESRRGQMDQNHEQGLHRTPSSLEWQLEDQKKPCDWQQCSQALPSMLLVSPGVCPTPPPPKRSRLQTPPDSSSALICSSPSMAQQGSGPSPITLPALPQLPTGSQLRTSCYDPAPRKEHSGAGPPGDKGGAGEAEDEEQAHPTLIEVNPTTRDHNGGEEGGKGVEDEEEEEEEVNGMQLSHQEHVELIEHQAKRLTGQQLTTNYPPVRTCCLTDRMKVKMMILLFQIFAISTLKLVSALDISDKRLENVALRGKATQSVTLRGGNAASSQADHGIDGNRDSTFDHGSCFHTERGPNPWWRVDLLEMYVIASVTITNRGDCCAERINGAEIHIGNSLENNGIDNQQCRVVSTMAAGETKTFQCDVPLSGRYVTVYLPGTEYLHLCEVEVNAWVPVA